MRLWPCGGPLARKRQKGKTSRRLFGAQFFGRTAVAFRPIALMECATMVLYGGPILLLASVPAFFYGLGAAGPLATVLLLLLALIGAEFVSPRGHVIGL